MRILTVVSIILTLLILGPPALGALYTVLTDQPMPVFVPHDLLSKIGYGSTWGFWMFWQWIRPVAGLTGGAQVAMQEIKDGTIGQPTSASDFNASQTWYNILSGVVAEASAYNVTDYYLQYANGVSVDANQTWQLTLFIVSNNGTVLLTRMDATWSSSPTPNMALNVNLPSTSPPTEILPHYGITVTLDTINVADWLMNGTQIDWGKVGMNTLQTLYKGNVQAWVIKS